MAEQHNEQAATPDEEWLDFPTAEKRYKTTARHLRRLQYEGRIPYYRLGGKVRFKASDIEAYLESTRRGGEAS